MEFSIDFITNIAGLVFDFCIFAWEYINLEFSSILAGFTIEFYNPFYNEIFSFVGPSAGDTIIQLFNDFSSFVETTFGLDIDLSSLQVLLYTAVATIVYRVLRAFV